MAEDEEVIAEFMTETEARAAQIRLAEEAIDGWVCDGCDTIVAPEEAFCPECGSTRSHVDPRDEDYDDDED